MRVDFPDEGQMVRLLVAGDRAAFETLYRRMNAAMLRMCMSLVRNRATAEEVVQDTWVAVLRGIDRFEGRSSLAGWIFSILINRSLSRASRDGRIISFDGAGAEDTLAAAFDGHGRWKNLPDLWDAMTAERIIAGRSVLEHVTSAIDTLPPAQRLVLILRSQQGMTGAEVARMLDISEANVRVLLHRARMAVRNALDDLA
jgi:RNA polymerase sigma-70 factor (ECF subfamily)